MLTTTNRELSAGAHEANQEVSCFPNTSAVPVLPPTRTLSSGKPANAVSPDTPSPLPKTSESRMNWSTSGRTGTLSRTFGVISRTTFPVGSTMARPMVGSKILPPLTIAE